MGNPIASPNVFMGTFDMKANEQLPFFPRCSLSYVGDILVSLGSVD